MPYIDQFLQANPEFANKDENALAEALYNAHFKDEGTLDEFKAEFLGSKESTLQDIGAAAGTAPIKLAQVVAGIPAGVSDAVTWAANKAASGLGLAPPNYTGRDNPIVTGSRALSDSLGKLADAVGEELHTDEFNRKAKAEAARPDKGTIGGLWDAATSGDMDLLKKQANANWEDVKDAAAFYGNNPLHGFAAGVESAPMMLAPMAAAKMAGGAGLSATKAAIATGAAMEGASAASGTRMRIDDMSVDDLSLVSPEFNNLLMQGMAPETAKSELARLAGGEAFTISAIASGIASKLTGAGKFEADVGTGGVGGVFKGGLRGGATEFPQEFIESGAGQYAENQAIKDFANSEQNLSQGVLKAATQGGIVGMGTGATVGAARGLFGSNPMPTEQTDNRPDVTGKDGTDLLGNQGNSPVIDAHLKRTQDELKAFEQQEAEALNAGLAQAVQNAQAASVQNQQATAQAMQSPEVLQAENTLNGLMPQDPELQAMAAQGVPVVEITPPVQEQPQSKVKAKPKPEPVTPFDEVAEDAQAPEQNAFKGLPIQELPVDKLTLSNDVPQFKDGANDSGVVEPLGGKFDRTGVAPIQVWQRNDGRMEVISGRHRLDLARRSGESTIPVQVHREADGFDADRASTLDAELNIRDGQGKVADYVQYFTKSNIDKQEAIDRGLLSRAIGKRAYAIATQGDSELIAAHRANVATDLGAYTIATAFPNDGKRQQVALARLQQGDNVEKAVNVARALSAITGGDSNMDMFGFDDAAIKEAERMAKEAVSIQRQITNDIAAVQGAAKNPKAAAKFGVNVSDPDGVKKRIEELKEERAQWDNWHTNPALVAQLRGDNAQAVEPIAQTQPNTAQDDFLTSYDESTIQSQEADAKALAQQQAAQQNKEAIDAGVDNFSLDMGNVPDDDGGATFDMFSDPVPVAQPKPTQAPAAVETVTPTYDTIADNQEIVPSKSGEPFKTIAAAKLSATFKNTPNAEIKQIGDKQFVVVKAKQQSVTQKVEAQAQPKFETDIKQANQASYEQIKSEMLNNGWEVEGDKLKKTIQTDNKGDLSDGSRIVYASHKNGAVQLEYGFNSQQVPFNTYNNDPVKTIADVERRMTKLVSGTKQDKSAQETKAEKPKSTEQAEAEAMIAEGLDELMSLLGGKKNLTPEQESQIIPIMAKLFRGFAKLGYIKFKDAAAKVYDTIESKLGKDIADQISIDNLQAGYINIASEIGGNKKDALMVESIDELRNSEATNNVTANDTSNVLEQNSQDATTQNAVGKKRVQAESGRDGRSDGQRDQGSGSQVSSNDVGSSAGVAGYETPVTGERGNIEVYTGSNARTETSSTRSDVDSGSSNDSYDGVPIEQVGATTTATATTSLGERVLIREQQKKPSKGKQTDGIESIREELPFLLPPQQEDVAKAETIYQEPTGYGMLFTNGTGTGKTFTGLGIVKRFANRGKTNTLIIAPSEQIIKQWVDAARDFFALTVNQLENTVSAGKGIVITTYANLTANNELAKRDWDLVVADEAQRLLMNESGEPTGAIKNFRAITNHKRGAITRTEMLHHELYAELKQVQSDLKGAKVFDNDAYLPEIARLEAKQNKLLEQIQSKRAEVDTQVAATQGEKRSRTLFLSATPFAYEKTIDWAEGYLFDYAEGSSKESDGQAYNSGNTKDQFFMRHFGYRMRFNKLTEPDVGVDRGLMQRQFNTWLKKKGVLSGRMLEVDADYDRKFVLVNSGIGTRIDEALRWLSDKSRNGNTAASELSKELNDKFDYLSRQYLLEAIKAKEVIAHIKEHLALGRKVVVFHDFIKGGGVNPFKLGEYSGDPERESLLREFNSEFRDLINSSAFNASSPIETLSEAFPGLLLFNGRVPKNVRKDNVTKFQDDASGPKVILVQSAAGKEGISLHDTTGKHQRVLFNLGQPTQPTTAIQQEGRIYRTGQKSDAIIRYLNTGTNWEKFAFATKIAERASAAENLGMGELARALKDAFISAFDQSDDYRAGMENEGKGGKELDKAANNALTEYDRARAFYFANQKKTSKNKAAEGVDYFATPEPVGLKMVEMADIRIGESALEPSAGHGAIARWMPSYAKVKAIEPSLELQSRLAMNVSADSIIGSTFEAFNVVNKFDAIVMNPPFGVGGKTAIEHLDKASKHLRNGGRIVALIPSGPAADKRLNAWLYGNDKEEGAKDFYLVADVLLPTSTFERAGTQVSTHIVVLEKQTDKTKVEKIHQHGVIDYRSADSVKDLFDRMEFLQINSRAVDTEKPTDYQAETSSNQSSTNVTPASNNGDVIEHTTKAGKVIRGVVRTDLTQAQAKKIDEFTFKKDGGYFIREKHLASLANMDAGVKFSQSAMKSVDANIKRGTEAMNKAIAEKTSVNRAMYRNDIGWVDFVWGDEGVVKQNGKTKGAMGLSHIIEARMRKDGMTYDDVSKFLTQDIVKTIANGKMLFDPKSVGNSENIRLDYDGNIAYLAKNKGSNSWVITAFVDNGSGSKEAAYDSSIDTFNATTPSRSTKVAEPYKNTTTDTLTKQQATDIVNKNSNGKRLLKNKKLKVLGSIDEAPDNVQDQITLSDADGNIQGFFDPATDTTYLVADALTKDTIIGVMTHEVGGHAWWRNADKATREALGNRAAKLIEHGIEFGNERLKAFYSGVQSRLVEAKVVGNNEEAFAYLAEEAINKAKAWRYALSDSRFIDAIAKVSTRLANLMSDAIAYLKSSMHRLGWLDTDKLTGADLVAIAKRNMREVSTDKPTDPNGSGKGVKFSIQQNQNQLTDQIDEIQKAVDEQRSKVLNRLKVSGVDHAGWMLGIPNLKQLADIAKHKLPQIQEYTEITDRMAGYRNKLMTESGDIANDVRKWVGKNRAAANRLFDLMHEATISGIDPSEPYKAMDLSLLKQKQAHLDIMQGLSDDHAAEIDALEKQIQYELSGERRADYDALAKKWALIPNGGRRVFQLMRDHYKLRALQTQKELLARIARSGLDDEMKQTSMGALRLQFESTMNSGVYFPLARFGEYWLSGKNPKGEREFRMYDNESERRTAERKMIDLGYTDVASGVKLDANALEAGANGAFVSDAISKLDEALGEDAKQLKDDIYQFYLQSLPDMSMRKAFIHRKKTKGYSADALRAFAQKTFHMAHQLSKLRHSDQLTDKLDSIRKEAAKGDVMKGRFYNEMVKRHNWVLNPTDSEKSAKLTGLGFLWYLGASPAAAAVNTTQLVVTTLPVLSADHGSKAFSELGKGMKDAVSDKNLAADELAMMTLFTEEGVIETTMAHDLAGMADTETGKYNEKWAQAMSVVSWMFHKAEVFNRRATALAAYRLAKSSNHADPVGYARQKIWETQFDYSNSNRARWMQANWVKVVTLFKQYALNMSYFIVKNTKEAITGTDLIGQTLSTQERKIAKRKIIGLTIATLAMGGLAATPFYFAILALAGMAGDDDEDSRDTLHDMLSDWFGEDWARFILKGGVNATSGVDISSRMATDLLGMWYRTNDEAKDEAEWTQQFFIQQLGPVFGIAINVGEGIVKIKKGEIERGAEQMVPKSIKDLMQAARFANEGALTLGGDKDYAGTVLVDEFNAWQLFMKANGFTPEELSNRYDANSRFIRKDKAIKERRAGILTEYWTAFRNDDKEAMNAIIKKDVMEFNAKYPQFAIDGDTLSSSIKTRIKGMQGMENGVYVSPKMKAYMEQNNN